MGLEKEAQTLLVLSFWRGLPKPQGYPTCGQKKYKIHYSIKQRPLVVASWNVRILQDTLLVAERRTALIACELARYYIDIAALNETRLPDEGSLVEVGTGYTFSGIVYQQQPVTFMAMDFQLGLLFYRTPKNPPWQ